MKVLLQKSQRLITLSKFRKQHRQATTNIRDLQTQNKHLVATYTLLHNLASTQKQKWFNKKKYKVIIYLILKGNYKETGNNNIRKHYNRSQ